MPCSESGAVCIWKPQPLCTTDAIRWKCGTPIIMSNLIEDAVRELRDLPEDIQQAAARAIIDYGAGYDDDLQLSDEQVAEVERPIANFYRWPRCGPAGSKPRALSARSTRHAISSSDFRRSEPSSGTIRPMGAIF